MRSRDYFREALSELAKPNALGLHLVVLIIAYPPLVGALQPPPPGYELPIPMVWFDISGGLSVALTLLAARLLARRISFGLGRNMLAWLVASASGVAGQLALIQAFGKIPDVYLESTPIGTIANFGLLTVFHLITSGIVSLVRESRLVAVQRAQVDRIANEMQVLLQDQGDLLGRQVSSELVPLLQKIKDKIEARESSSALSDEVRAVIDEQVRPLSSRLQQGEYSVQFEPTFDDKQVRPNLPIQLVKQRSLVLTSSGVSLSLVGFLLFALPSHIFLFGSQPGFLSGLVTLCVVAFLGYSAATFLRSRRVFMPIGILTNAVFGLLAGLVSFEVRLITIPGVEEGLSEFLSLQAFLIVFLGFSHATLLDASWMALRNKELLLRKRQKLLLRLQVALELQSRKLAYLIHGKVQATLQAISIRLANSEEPGPNEIAAVSSLLQRINLDLTTAPAAESHIESFDELVELWDGICEVNVVASELATKRLADDEQLRVAALLVVEEFVTNSVKHSSAHRVEVDFSVEDSGLMNLVLTSEFEPIERSVQTTDANQQSAEQAGVGHKIFDAMTLQWTVEQLPGKYRLRATF